MHFEQDLKLDYKDVSIISREISTIDSRSKIDTTFNFCGLKLKCPIIASPMRDVCDANIAKLMFELGGFGILHRFCSIEEQVLSFIQADRNCGCAIGINGDYLDRFNALYEAGCRIFCLDIANGANILVGNVITKQFNKPDIRLIVGNVVSSQGFGYLSQFGFGVGAKFNGVSAIRVGVAGGSACRTRNATGIYSPAISLIHECEQLKKQPLIIADGGIKEPQDFCKAIVAGAGAVMLGSIIAACKESPAKLDNEENPQYKIYSGSASFEVQKIYKDSPRYIEGATTYLEYNNDRLEDIIGRFMDGLVSSMSYLNAQNLEEYRKKAILARVCS